MVNLNGTANSKGMIIKGFLCAGVSAQIFINLINFGHVPFLPYMQT